MWAMGVGAFFLALIGNVAVSAAGYTGNSGDAVVVGVFGAVWLLAGAGLFAYTAYFLAQYKGRNAKAWAFVSFFGGALALAILALLRRRGTSPAVVAPNSSLSGELAELANLHKAGVLSTEEYTEAKQRVLSR
jgi:hypothetical protein